MAGSMATRSPRRGPSAMTPAASCPSTSGRLSVASPIPPSPHQCRSEPQMPTAVTWTRLSPGPGHRDRLVGEPQVTYRMQPCRSHPSPLGCADPAAQPTERVRAGERRGGNGEPLTRGPGSGYRRGPGSCFMSAGALDMSRLVCCAAADRGLGPRVGSLFRDPPVVSCRASAGHISTACALPSPARTAPACPGTSGSPGCPAGPSPARSGRTARAPSSAPSPP